ncbi:hypothetical protein RHGRI_007259 [Rhododendron griersonianum]|uniref:Uncharacterized protein n=1 Tax=Rhododendron griersonianum TaxID=479676 RepID=A0AAV6KXT1_9ERIC|nr:hypothetical protein RHGRI_007259 [Rhododendron griersonianum]
MLWRIWKCPNEKIFDGRSVEGQNAVLLAVKDASEFIIQAMDSGEAVKSGGNVSRSTYRQPEMGNRPLGGV